MLQSGSQSSRDLLSANALLPSDIREALRRYTQSVGPFDDFVVSFPYFELL